MTFKIIVKTKNVHIGPKIESFWLIALVVALNLLELIPKVPSSLQETNESSSKFLNLNFF